MLRIGASKQIEPKYDLRINKNSSKVRKAVKKDNFLHYRKTPKKKKNCDKMNRSFMMGNFSWTSETSDQSADQSVIFDTTPEKRRKFSTKDCEECKICSDEVFQVCHPHIKNDGVTTKKQEGRQKIVLGSSTLAHLWKSYAYNKSPFHIDFDCIIGGQIHDVHLSFIRQYKDVADPLDIVLACGMNNVPTEDTHDDIVFQFESFLRSISEHSEIHNHESPNRVVICPLLYAPKFCDAKLNQTENHLPKIFRANQWIKQFNEMNTGLHINLDEIGVKKIPESPTDKVEHIYEQWNETQWQRMLHLNRETKGEVATQLIDVFSALEKS